MGPIALPSSDVRSDAGSDVPVADAVMLSDLAGALTAPPLWDKQVLELALDWPALAPEHKWAVDRLRVFLLTWDPFEWRPQRPVAFATSTSRGDSVGLVLYLPLWQAMALAGGDASALPGVLGPMAESILTVGGQQREAIVEGAYAAGVHAGALPRLLSQIPAAPTLASPIVTVVGDGWQPIQFDVLEDLGQDLFGPADLDRSPARFREPGERRENCPGCAGRSVEFPDGLKDTQEVICGPHRAEALRITTARLEAAKASNPEGWEALLEAGQRLLEAHLPNGLGPRLVAAAGTSAAGTSAEAAGTGTAASAAGTSAPAGTSADAAAAAVTAAADLAASALVVIEAGSLMAGLPDPQTALGGRLAPVRDWLPGLPASLAAAGLVDEVEPVTAAVNELLSDPSVAAAQAAVAAAQEELEPKPVPFRRETRIGRNALCPCGSGNKYKFCHGR